MIVYNFHPVTKEFLGSQLAQQNPKRPGQFLMPANSTTTAPGQKIQGQSYVWDGSKWDSVIDLRGRSYYDKNGSRHIITALGMLLPQQCTWEPKVIQKSLQQLKQEAYHTLWSNYKKHQTTYIDAQDLTLAVLCAQGGSEKGRAMQMWVMNLWAYYYEVKDAVAAAETKEALANVDLTATHYGTPPHTIRQLNQAAQTYLKLMEGIE